MNKSFLIVLHLLVFPPLVFAQNRGLVDSLESVLTALKAGKRVGSPEIRDTTSANILIRLSELHWENNPKKAEFYAQKSLSLSDKIGFKKGSGNALNGLGRIHSIQGEFPQALPYYENALRIRRETRDLPGISATLNNLGNAQLHMGKKPEALRNFLEALKLDEALKDKEAIAMDCGNLGALYIQVGEFEEAQKMLETSLRYNIDLGNKNRLAKDYQNLGTLFLKRRDIRKAEDYNLKAIQLYESLGQKLNLSRALNDLGTVYFNQGKYLKAKETYSKALTHFEEIGNTNGMVFAREHLGWANINLGKASEAQSDFLQAIELNRTVGSRDLYEGAYRGLAMADSMKGNFESAFKNHKMAVLYRDSLQNRENTKKITEQRMQFDFDKKETALKFQKRLTDEQLEMQKLLAIRQRQEIDLKEQAILLANHNKDLAQLEFQKEKAEKENKSKQLILSEKEKELQEAALLNSEADLKRQTLIRNAVSIGLVALMVFSLVVIRQRNRVAKEKRRSDQLVLEKEMLMKEIHHRVKNNLEVISSLLELQSDGMDEGKAKSAVMEGQSRVQSIALIHHKLYQTEDVASVEFRSFVHDLYKQIETVFRKPDSDVEFEIHAIDISISIDSAVPLGLIINELLTNSFKYAISDQQKNKISIELKPGSESNRFVLVYRDNGPGLPADYNMKKSVSLGMKVIQLLTRQLGGKLNFYNDGGSVFEVPFIANA
jgi:two-component sensor histidine kinase